MTVLIVFLSNLSCSLNSQTSLSPGFYLENDFVTISFVYSLLFAGPKYQCSLFNALAFSLYMLWAISSTSVISATNCIRMIHQFEYSLSQNFSCDYYNHLFKCQLTLSLGHPQTPQAKHAYV